MLDKKIDVTFKFQIRTICDEVEGDDNDIEDDEQYDRVLATEAIDEVVVILVHQVLDYVLDIDQFGCHLYCNLCLVLVSFCCCCCCILFFFAFYLFLLLHEEKIKAHCNNNAISSSIQVLIREEARSFPIPI